MYSTLHVDDNRIPLQLLKICKGEEGRVYTIEVGLGRERSTEDSYRLFSSLPEGGVGLDQVWMPAYASILRIPQMI
jgi:hypothetical protein